MKPSPFGPQSGTQSTEPHQPGPFWVFMGAHYMGMIDESMDWSDLQAHPPPQTQEGDETESSNPQILVSSSGNQALCLLPL